MLNRLVNKIKRTLKSKRKKIQYIFQFRSEKNPKNKIKNRIPLITIFGSCRQDSLYNLYPITSIKNNLTYTHYTKEIIQAIKYCKDPSEEFDEVVYFRTPLLKKKFPKKSFKKEFENTDIFVVEIASRIAYQYKDKYIHHEAYDNPVYRDLLTEAVIIKELTNEEIESDLLEIRDLLYPKKVVVVSHIDTKKTGTRSNLVNLLKNICPKIGIPLIDPSILLENHSENLLFEKNDSARHYTRYGHSKIQVVYKNVIDSLIDSKQDNLIQVYSSRPKKDYPGSYHGFGDFLMGALSVNQVAKKLGRVPLVSFNDHLINNFFYNRTFVDSCDLNNIKHLFSDSTEIIDFQPHKHVFTNKKPESLSAEDKNFVLMNCLQPRISFSNQLENLTNSLKLPNHFITLHIRGRDNDEITEENLVNITQIINKIIKPEKKYLLLSNSNKILEYINNESCVKTNLGRCHTGIQNVELSNLKDTLLEFMLMSRSEEIIQLSCYKWGSNFSNIIAELYDIPITKYKINS